MSFLVQVPRYGRWSGQFMDESGIERVRLVSPSGQETWLPVFEHHPAVFHYDEHGYEAMQAGEKPVRMARFTPQEVGEYQFEARKDGRVIDRGVFECLPSDHPGFVRVSTRDPRYFACSDGSPFIPIGLNLCSPPFYPLPRGREHFAIGDQKATLGLREYARWFRLLSENGGNFTRIWLSTDYLQTETNVAGQVNPLTFNRLDGIVELARRCGIRLKLCFDHFRAFSHANPHTQAFFQRSLVHPQTGLPPAGMDEWLSNSTWQDFWFQKVQAYLARYGGDPVVMAWELWNEMDCVEASHWELVREWTRTMLARIKQAVPEQLVVNSLGSFDDERKEPVYADFAGMPEMEFLQVHRYLDQGAPWQICREDPVALSVSAVQQACRPDRPALLAETGAVNDCHTGEFRFYRRDNDGLIFNDTTFPAFFAGAAGTGQHWFWDRYVDQKDCWGQFRAFASLLAGVVPDQENFHPRDLSTPEAWCLALVGSGTTLIWLRSRFDSWQAVLRDEVQPRQVAVTIPLGFLIAQVQWFSSWADENQVRIYFENGSVRVENLKHGIMLRVHHGVEKDSQ